MGSFFKTVGYMIALGSFAAVLFLGEKLTAQQGVGSGGHGPYTAGQGLLIARDVISVDPAAVPTFLRTSGSISFTSIAPHTCADFTSIRFPGAQIGDSVIPAYPATLESNLAPSMWISAPNTLKIRLCNDTNSGIHPINQTFGATIVRSF